MRLSSFDLVLESLNDLIGGLENGARLPTVRELMKQYGVSQAAVQQAFASLSSEGLITSQVGRGTFVTRTGEASRRDPTRQARPADEPDSLLILSNASMNQRCVLVQNRIVNEMAGQGSKVVQMSYHHTGHLLDILSSLPRFDGVILQSHYEDIPVRLLHLLQEKTGALIVDGHSLSGVDVDRVGTDWEDALDMALQRLTDLGHHEIGLVSLHTMAQPILSVRRAFERASRRCKDELTLHPPVLLASVRHPTQNAGAPLEAALSALRGPDGRLPFTAVILVGISDTMGVGTALQNLSVAVPADLGVYILGHHDVPTEHLEFFTIAGSSHDDAAVQLIATLRNRLATPALPPQVVYLQCREIVRESMAPPGSATRKTGRKPNVGNR